MAFSGRTDQLLAHSRSPAWRKRCSELMKKINAERVASGARCGARRRSDGEPCQQIVLFPNGRCRLHGGKTPKGKDWHKVQYPGPGTPIEAAMRKERVVAKRQKKRALARAEKLAAMTPEQRARYDHQFAKRVMTPGPAAPRIRTRKAREQAKWVQELIAPPAEPQKTKNPIRAPKAELLASAESANPSKPVPISTAKLRELFP